jgi:hypothetical protein
MRQDGPEYFSMPDQQAEQKGASLKVSGSVPQMGHAEG